MSHHKHTHHHDDHHAHSHGHHHHHHHHNATANISFAFFLNLFFALVEFVGGLFTGSVAILSDALHDIGDAISLGVAWRLQKISERGSNKHYSYGYKRFSLLGAMLISLILLVGAIFVIRESVEKLITPGDPDAKGMFLLALFGLFINGLAAYRLAKGESVSERAVMLHMMEDVLGWGAVLVVSIVMYFVHLPILDPLLSLGITAWILYNVYHNLRDTLHIMLQGVPQGVDRDGFVRDIEQLAGVCGWHDLHLWTLDGEQHIGSVHIVYKGDTLSTGRELAMLKQMVRELGKKHGVDHLTIELEAEGECCTLQSCC